MLNAGGVTVGPHRERVFLLRLMRERVFSILPPHTYGCHTPSPLPTRTYHILYQRSVAFVRASSQL